MSKASLAGILAVSALVPVAAASAATNYAVDEIVVAIDGKNVTVSKGVYDAAIAEGWMAGATVSHVQNSDGKYYSKAVLDEAVSEAATLTEALELLADSNKAVTITTVPGKFVDGTLVPEEQVVADLKVESVMAINDITVAYGEETAQTVLAGLPTTVTATLNDEETTEVTLDVEWAADANYDENVAGVYTFTGAVTLPADVDYTISEALSTVTVKVTVEAATEEQIDAAIDAINLANTGTIIAALKSPVLGLSDVNEDLADEYVAEIAKSFTTTKAQIQAAVNRANAAAAETNADAIKAVNEATGAVSLLTALDDLGIGNVIGTLTGDPAAVDTSVPSLAAQYFTAISNETTDTKAQIQAVIDQVNLKELTKLVVAAEKSVKGTDVATAQALLDAYLPVDTGEVTTVADFQSRLDVVTALIAVNEEKASGDAGVDLLAALKDPALKLKNVVDGNADDYLVAFKARVAADAKFEFATVSALQSFVNKVNADTSTGLITAVNTAGLATDDATGATFLAKIKLTSVTTVDDNAKAYLDAFKAKVATDSKFKFTTVEEIKTFVKAVNTAETEKTLVGAINTASASGIEAALTAFVGEYNNDAYVNLGSSLNGKRNEVARLFRGIKADTTYKTKEDVQTALTSATVQYNTALNNVLNSKSIAETRTNLQAVYDLALTYFTEEEIGEINGATVTVTQAETLFGALEDARENETALPKNFEEVITAATPA